MGTPAKSIVVCDDNEDWLSFTQIYLTRNAFRVSTAKGYSELLPLLKAKPYDLLILDIRMPEMDGFDIIEHIQEAGYNPHILLLTGHDHFMYRNYAPVLGVKGFLTKPVDPDVLLAKVHEILA